MDSLLVPRSTKEYHNPVETTYDHVPVFDSYNDNDYDDMLLLAELPSPPDSPRSSERTDSASQQEYEEYPSKQTRSSEANKMCKLLNIRRVLYSRTGSEIRDEIIRIYGRFTIPVHDHLKYKQLKNIKN